MVWAQPRDWPLGGRASPLPRAVDRRRRLRAGAELRASANSVRGTLGLLGRRNRLRNHPASPPALGAGHPQGLPPPEAGWTLGGWMKLLSAGHGEDIPATCDENELSLETGSPDGML